MPAAASACADSSDQRAPGLTWRLLPSSAPSAASPAPSDPEPDFGALPTPRLRLLARATVELSVGDARSLAEAQIGAAARQLAARDASIFLPAQAGGATRGIGVVFSFLRGFLPWGR